MSVNGKKDIEKAKSLLSGHTLVLCKGENTLISDGRGISPMLDFIGSRKDLTGYCAADVIVGKAAAMLFVYAGIAEVFAKTLSEQGKRVLETHGIPYTYETLTERIINRAGTDVCPMEKSLEDISDPNAAYPVLLKKRAELRTQNKG